ncbi:hypothetical protein [Paenibacillus thermotolerans]|uniref:hypothetical protein n=1 Tax=Paenibacillus thermotolerans TaxID=3027807 RepID=UPI002367DD08|nr:MULTISPECIES: hypothetical protein [unclassified Paenibacillus]
MKQLNVLKEIDPCTLRDVLDIWEKSNKNYDQLDLPIIGIGGFAHVYEYISKDNIKYAIKAIRKDHDGNYLTQKDERNLELL